MCTRYCLTSEPDAARERFGYTTEHDFPPRYNIAPTQPVAIVRLDHGHRRELALVRWGLIPSWSKDPAAYAPLINARAETAAMKPSFRGPLRHRRCLIPANGYYEWSGKAGARQAYLVRPRAGGLIGLAGLWEHWLGADGSEIETMAVLTTTAGGDLAALSDRMPVIIGPEDEDIWLDTRPGTSTTVGHMLRPAPDGLLKAFEISPAINNPRDDGHDLSTEISRKLL